MVLKRKRNIYVHRAVGFCQQFCCDGYDKQLHLTEPELIVFDLVRCRSAIQIEYRDILPVEYFFADQLKISIIIVGVCCEVYPLLALRRTISSCIILELSHFIS